MKKAVSQEISKWMALILIVLSVVSIFLEYRYTKEKERLDEIKSVYDMKLEEHSNSQEEEYDVFVPSEKLSVILLGIDESNAAGFHSREELVDVEMIVSNKEELNTIRECLKKKGYTSYISQGQGKEKWDSLILTVK